MSIPKLWISAILFTTSSVTERGVVTMANGNHGGNSNGLKGPVDAVAIRYGLRSQLERSGAEILQRCAPGLVLDVLLLMNDQPTVRDKIIEDLWKLNPDKALLVETRLERRLAATEMSYNEAAHGTLAAVTRV